MDLDIPNRWDSMQAWGCMDRKRKALKGHGLQVRPRR